MFSTKEPIFLLFEQIQHDDHVERILFYEENTAHIFNLEEEKQIYFSYHYITSLYVLGKYEKVITEIDPIIEYVFLNHVNYLPVGTFQDLLFKKASSNYEILNYTNAISIGTQLVGMFPDKNIYRKFLEKAYRLSYNFESSAVRLAAILLIFTSGIVGAIFWLLSTQGKYSNVIGREQGGEAFLAITSPCILALGLLGIAQVCYYVKSIRKVDRLVREKIAKRHEALERAV